MIWSYFAEFQPKKKRGAMLSFMAAFWTLGNLFVAGLAWIIIPSGEIYTFLKDLLKTIYPNINLPLNSLIQGSIYKFFSFQKSEEKPEVSSTTHGVSSFS